jgi:hypothetical protein
MGTSWQRLRVGAVPIKQKRQIALPPLCDGQPDLFWSSFLRGLVLRATLRGDYKVHRPCLTMDKNQVWFEDIFLEFHDGFIDCCAIFNGRDNATTQ